MKLARDKFKKIKTQRNMVYAIRKHKETTGALLRRFTKTVQQSGILLEARRTRFYSKKKNKRARKLSALRRMARGKEREKLLKLGRLRPKKETPRRFESSL